MRAVASLSKENSSLIKALILGVVCATAVIVILMCVCCVVFIASSRIPYEYLAYMLLVFDSVGIFAGGYIAGRINKVNGMLTGALTGLIVFIALLITGLCMSANSLTIITLCKALILIIFGALGGIKGVNRKEKIHIK